MSPRDIDLLPNQNEVEELRVEVTIEVEMFPAAGEDPSELYEVEDVQGGDINLSYRNGAPCMIEEEVETITPEGETKLTFNIVIPFMITPSSSVIDEQTRPSVLTMFRELIPQVFELKHGVEGSYRLSHISYEDPSLSDIQIDAF